MASRMLPAPLSVNYAECFHDQRCKRSNLTS